VLYADKNSLIFFSIVSSSEFSLASSYNARAYLFAVSDENDLLVLSLIPQD
jgi:hypothetical protein